MNDGEIVEIVSNHAPRRGNRNEQHASFDIEDASMDANIVYKTWRCSVKLLLLFLILSGHYRKLVLVNLPSLCSLAELEPTCRLEHAPYIKFTTPKLLIDEPGQDSSAMPRQLNANLKRKQDRRKDRFDRTDIIDTLDKSINFIS
ncbi:hypothetical protein Tco_0867843 [Tanacetum coccineum]